MEIFELIFFVISKFFNLLQMIKVAGIPLITFVLSILILIFIFKVLTSRDDKRDREEDD